LHTDELTYSVIAPLSDARVAGSLLESYQRLAGALVEALRLLVLPVQVQEHSSLPSSQNANPVCFEVPSSFEITVEGKKLIGSAQARRREGVLQHGSLPLYGDLTRITRVLAFPDQETREQAARRLLQRATTVEAALGREVTWQEAADAFVKAFQTVFQLDLQAGELSPVEKEKAAELAVLKYEHPEKSERVGKFIP
jgi:lipoate-protein ligase A